jgi:hypothetical protein
MFKFLLGKHPEVELLGQKEGVCLILYVFIRTVFQTTCNILHSHQKYILSSDILLLVLKFIFGSFL